MAKLNQKTRERIAGFWNVADLEVRDIGRGQAVEAYEGLLRRYCVEPGDAEEWTSTWMADQ